jgi:hypothetical protein
MTSLIEKVTDAIIEADMHWCRDGEGADHVALARAAIQVVLREMMDWERNTIFQSRAQMFAHKNGIDLSGPKP